MKAVFDVKPGSGYDDDITRRYHFPARRNYLDAAYGAVGDWVLFREPQRNGGRHEGENQARGRSSGVRGEGARAGAHGNRG